MSNGERTMAFSSRKTNGLSKFKCSFIFCKKNLSFEGVYEYMYNIELHCLAYNKCTFIIDPLTNVHVH